MPVVTCKKCNTFDDDSGSRCPACGVLMEIVLEQKPAAKGKQKPAAKAFSKAKDK